ncbi:hypothetical protein bcere0030_30490 [Bacillus cereus AH1273]|nr:hypothetical protein bcere0030_30490 [Bacillus cereus AH1273]
MLFHFELKLKTMLYIQGKEVVIDEYVHQIKVDVRAGLLKKDISYF